MLHPIHINKLLRCVSGFLLLIVRKSQVLELRNKRSGPVADASPSSWVMSTRQHPKTLHLGCSPGRGEGGGASAQNKAPAKVNLDHISQCPQRSPAAPKHRVECGSSSQRGGGHAFQHRVPQYVPSDVRQVAEPRLWHGTLLGRAGH